MNRGLRWAGLGVFVWILATGACGVARLPADAGADAGPGATVDTAGATIPADGPAADTGQPSAGTDATPTATVDGQSPDPSVAAPLVEVVRFGLTDGALVADFERLVGMGYRMVWQDGFDAAGVALFNSVYRLQTGGTEWRVRSWLSADALLTELATLRREGFRPLQVDSYVDRGAVRYAVVSDKSAGPEYVVYHGKSVVEHQRLFDERNAAGWAPINISVAVVAGVPAVTSLYENRNVLGHYSVRLLTRAELGAINQQQVEAGLKLVYVKAYVLDGSPRFSAIWHGDAPEQVALRQDLSAAQLRAELEARRQAGFLTTALSGYLLMGESRYVAIWSR